MDKIKNFFWIIWVGVIIFVAWCWIIFYFGAISLWRRFLSLFGKKYKSPWDEIGEFIQ